ncbi:MAG: nucleotidyltransferase domain-containing protein [Anaerolineaceae bacterium]|nr:nucleotidyltransferase domain-containing protein [Anaerolineaceae bacterium]
MNMEPFLQQIIESLKTVPGVSALVLGGSRAHGTQTSTSDYDLGIYYHPDRPLDLPALDRVAAALDERGTTGIVTPIGEWGPWINGGGWLKISGQAVDFLYRDLGKVSRMIDDCLEGKIEAVYQAGHPFGFVSSIYLAEAAVCRVLWDGEGLLSALKARITPYPEGLKRGLIAKFAWEMRFALDTGRKSIARGDVTYAAGCCFRGAGCLLQVLFALNGQHWLNEKGAAAIAEGFTQRPDRLQERLGRVFAALSPQPEDLERAFRELEELIAETEGLPSPQPSP